MDRVTAIQIIDEFLTEYPDGDYIEYLNNNIDDFRYALETAQLDMVNIMKEIINGV